MTSVSLQNFSPLQVLDPALYSDVAKNFLQKNNLPTIKTDEITRVAEVLHIFLQIPYENLSKIMKVNRMHQDAMAIRLPNEVWEDFQRFRLGGTCFSLTFFLQTIVHFLGFDCYPVMARMKIGPNHHCALVILNKGQHFLADPGYVLDLPMALSTQRIVQYRNAHTGVEIVPAEKALHYNLSTISRSEKQWRYEFADIPTHAEAFWGHWLHSFSWNGMNELCLSRNEKDALIYVRKFHMRQTTIHGKRISI